MSSFEFDQAEGLRRILAGSKARSVTFVSATSPSDKCAMLANLSASMAASGNNVLLLDACVAPRGIASHLGVAPFATLQDVARQERGLNELPQQMPQGFNVALLSRGPLRLATQDTDVRRQMANAYKVLAAQSDILFIDAELDVDDAFPIEAMADGDIVVQVAADSESIKHAYAIIKRLNAQLGRRPFGVLVTGADEMEAKKVFDNMAKASSKYLGLQLNSVGFVPADEYVTRATRLGRSVIEAFPLAGASIAFRRIATRFKNADATPGAFSGIS